MTKRYIQEAARLAPKRNPDGTWRLIVIDEGEGSSGVYSAELLAGSDHVFENSASFINHPLDPEKPHQRDLNTLAGRLGNLRVETIEGKTALVGDYRARTKEVDHMIENFGDIIGASIFCAAYGEKNDSGKVVVESFDAEDPYRSVDLVVAAGRGGRFDRAAESLRAIESSLGIAQGSQPGAASAPGSQKEDQMELKDVEALFEKKMAEALKPINDFFANEDARRQAEADAAASNDDVTGAVEAAIAAVEAVKAAKVLPSLEKKLVESATKGTDITADLEFAKQVTAESAAAKPAAPAAYAHEAASSNDDDGLSFNFGGSR